LSDASSHFSTGTVLGENNNAITDVATIKIEIPTRAVTHVGYDPRTRSLAPTEAPSRVRASPARSRNSPIDEWSGAVRES
jgi:hypothetical protein